MSSSFSEALRLKKKKKRLPSGPRAGAEMGERGWDLILRFKKVRIK